MTPDELRAFVESPAFQCAVSEAYDAAWRKRDSDRVGVAIAAAFKLIILETERTQRESK